MKIYGDRLSGNCYKIQLVCSLLGITHQWLDVDILAGDTKKQSFLQLNPNGKIPCLVLDDGRCLSESNAIINFLAADSVLLPEDKYQQALVQQWQFFEQYSHEPFIAVARFINKYLGLPEQRKAEYLAKQEGGYKALDIMEQQLSQSDFLTGAAMTTADISLFAYTHVAEEGGFELSKYKAINRWIKRVKAANGFVEMQQI